MMFYSVVQLMHIELNVKFVWQFQYLLLYIQYTIAVCMVIVLAIDSSSLYCM